MTFTHHLVLFAFAFCVGASVGSFLNVVIWRWPRGESVIRPRSHCPSCGQGIASRDNLPVIAWLLLRGRCRRCDWPIPARYPLVEASVGLLFAVALVFDVSRFSTEISEQTLLRAFAQVLYHWSLAAMLVTVTMIARDERLGITPVRNAAPCPSLVFGSLVALAGLVAAQGDDPLSVALNLTLLILLTERLAAPFRVPARAV